MLTPAFIREMRPVTFWTLTALRLRPGADAGDVRASIERITAAGGASIGPQVDRTRQVDRSVSPYTTALTLFALLAGVGGLLVVGQALTRQSTFDASSDPVLRALGLSGGQRVALTALRAGVVALVGAAAAVTVAVAVSPLTPVGPVRVAEPDPGIALDPVVLIVGTLVLMAVVVVWVVITSRLQLRRQRIVASAGTARPSFVSRSIDAVARGRAPVTVLTGVRFALLPGRGRATVPVRTTIAGTVIAVAALVGVMTFAASVDRLVDSPPLYGGDWDVTISGNGGYTFVGVDEETGDSPVGDLEEMPGVEAWSLASFGSVVVDGLGVPALGIGPVFTGVHPTLLEGRAAGTTDEIVLGSSVLRRLDKDVGDTVEVEGGEQASPKRIVGRAVFPSLGFLDLVHTALGDGAALTFRGFAQLEANAYPNAALVRLTRRS